MSWLEHFAADWGILVNPGTVTGALFYALVFGVLLTVVLRFIRAGVKDALRRDWEGRIDRTAIRFVSQLAQTLIIVMAVVLYAHLIPAMRSLGTALLASAGVASIVVGLAAQNTLGNLIAGLSLLIYRPFKEGDRLLVSTPGGSDTGVVESLTLGYAVLKTFDNRRIVLPNSIIASQITINFTAGDTRVMALVPIGISYTSDIPKARRILEELASSHASVLEVVGCPVVQLGDFSVTLSQRVWCHDYLAAKQFEYFLYEEAKKRFDEEGIEIPYPYRNVVLKRETNQAPEG